MVEFGARFDTLFTSKTIARARDITKQRLKMAKKDR